MTLLLVALGLILLAGLLALATTRSPAWSSGLGAGGVAAGCLVGLVPAVQGVLGGPPERLRVAWDIPYGAFALELDPLSAFFLIPLLALSALAAMYGWEYLKPSRTRRGQGLPWFFFALLVAAMVLVVVARNGMLFLAYFMHMQYYGERGDPMTAEDLTRQLDRFGVRYYFVADRGAWQGKVYDSKAILLPAGFTDITHGRIANLRIYARALNE